MNPQGSTPASMPPGSSTDRPRAAGRPPDTAGRGVDNNTPHRRPAMSDLLDRINDIRTTCRPRPTFTLERGRGETCRHPRPVLYAHSEYEASSVLAGQPRRLFVEQ